MRPRANGLPVEAIVIVILVLAIFFYVFFAPRWDRDRIHKKLEKQDEIVTKINYRFVETGPYWNYRGTRTYKVDTKQGNVYFIRFGAWGGPNIAKKVENDYEEMNW